jgi:hypothetical protein
LFLDQPTVVTNLGCYGHRYDRKAELLDKLIAKWIWHPQDDYCLYNQTILARKTFFLDGMLDSAQLRITADTSYRLVINDEWVNDGPCRSWPEHYQYDEINVVPFLHRALPPEVLEVLFELNSERAVVPATVQATIKFGGLKDETLAFAKGNDFFHTGGISLVFVGHGGGRLGIKREESRIKNTEFSYCQNLVLCGMWARARSSHSNPFGQADEKSARNRDR